MSRSPLASGNTFTALDTRVANASEAQGRSGHFKNDELESIEKDVDTRV